jgi:CHAT domain-containing protein
MRFLMMKLFHQILFVLCLVLSSQVLANQTFIEKGNDAFKRGHFELAIQHWAKARTQLSPENNSEDYVDISVDLAEAYRHLGRLGEALRVLKPAHFLAKPRNDLILRAKVLVPLADIYFAMRDLTHKDVERIIKAKNLEDFLENFQKETSLSIRKILLKQTKDSLKETDIDWIIKPENLQILQERFPREISLSTRVLILRKAKRLLEDANKLLPEKGEDLLRAKILNKQGNVFSALAEENMKVAKKNSFEAKEKSAQAKKLEELSKKQQENSKKLRELGEEEWADEFKNDATARKHKSSLLKEEAKQFDEKANEQFDEAQQKSEQALSSYQKSVKLAIHAGNCELSAKVNMNIIQHAVQFEKYGTLKNELSLKTKTLLQKIKTCSALGSHEQAYALINLAKLMRDAFEEQSFSDKKRAYQYAYNALIEARKIAHHQKNNLALAYAEFYLAQLYAEQKSDNYKYAIKLTEDAIHRIQSYPILYKKETHIGSFVSKRFQVYVSSPDDHSPEECRKMCQGEYQSFVQNPLSKKCQGDCKALPPLFTEGYHPDLLFRLKRQLGDFLKRQGQVEKAKQSYLEAIEYLQQLRESYRCGTSYFGETAEEFLGKVADFLLQSAKTAKSLRNRKDFLKTAINTIELLKKTELQNYFQDICVTKTPKAFLDNHLPPNTAIFYPILFKDKNCRQDDHENCQVRLELLLFFGDDDIVQIDRKIKANDLKITAQNFRDKIASKTDQDKRYWEKTNLPQIQKERMSLSYDYRPDAKKLYTWFIEPIKKELKDVNTLIIVLPDELLDIPFAAFYNGKKFLVEEYALAFIPSRQLTEPKKISRDNIYALLSGLKQCDKKRNKLCNDEMSELKHAIKELDAVADILDDTATNSITKLSEERFTIPEVESELNSTYYSIIHFTTHGQFQPDPNQTFLLTYDDALRINRLEKLLKNIAFRDKPVELLTLSACQSAKGGERGLAGVAIKTGVRSAFATLWLINDEFARNFVTDFYASLFEKNQTLSKAQILRNIHKIVIHGEKEKYDSKTDPYYWAPFILIGNWL